MSLLLQRVREDSSHGQWSAGAVGFAPAGGIQPSVIVAAVLSALSPASLWAMMVTVSNGRGTICGNWLARLRFFPSLLYRPIEDVAAFEFGLKFLARWERQRPRWPENENENDGHSIAHSWFSFRNADEDVGAPSLERSTMSSLVLFMSDSGWKKSWMWRFCSRV